MKPEGRGRTNSGLGRNAAGGGPSAQGRPSAGKAGAAVDVAGPTNSALAVSTESTIPGLSGEQFQELLAFLSEVKGQRSIYQAWIY